MTDQALGPLARVDLRDIWTTEANDFTPWLARPENLAVLGDTLGIELELEAQEQAVGPFRADILCKDSESEAWVLIENQLERTDHTHLGQLLTYASGLEAVVIVWIAASFTEEHRATLDWLNRITDSSFQFFALEVELWRIGNSPAAPKFNVVAKPNDWSRSVARAARSIDESELPETRIMQRAYWDALNAALDQAKGPVSGARKPQLKSWMRYSIGKSDFSLGAAIAVTKRQIRTYLRIAGETPKASFHLLLEQADEIKQELGYPLVWNQEPTGRRGRVSVYLNDVDPRDEADWPRQHEWLVTRINDMHRAFAQRVKSLDPDEWQSETEPHQDTATTQAANSSNP